METPSRCGIDDNLSKNRNPAQKWSLPMRYQVIGEDDVATCSAPILFQSKEGTIK
jgi:hypothetical protein